MAQLRARRSVRRIKAKRTNSQRNFSTSYSV
jgi:hypothetical protein